MTVAALEELTVARFPPTSVRAAIFGEFRRLVSELAGVGFIGEIWVDGSFLTEKTEPDVDDMDLSVRITSENMDALEPATRQNIINALNGGKRYSLVLDTYICIMFPKGDPRQPATTDDYWAEKWLVGWDDRTQGIRGNLVRRN